MKKNRFEDDPIIYNYDTSTIALNVSTYNINYSYQEVLEEPSNKEIFPFVKRKET